MQSDSDHNDSQALRYRELFRQAPVSLQILAPDGGTLRVNKAWEALVLVNLLNNAAKYTPQGGSIALSVRREGREVRIAVRDNGIGIDAGLLPQVFDLFTQAERTPDRAQGGLGIGLALVRNIVVLHGGTVAAHSDGPGLGSSFTVTLDTVA